jgi:hypothetical protein
MECRNKIEDDMREKTEEVAALTWCGRSVGPTSEKLELTHPLYLLQQARLENNDVKRQLVVKRSTAVGPAGARLTPAILCLQRLEELG